jgi:hypothetical protein
MDDFDFDALLNDVAGDSRPASTNAIDPQDKDQLPGKKDLERQYKTYSDKFTPQDKNTSKAPSGYKKSQKSSSEDSFLGILGHESHQEEEEDYQEEDSIKTKEEKIKNIKKSTKLKLEKEKQKLIESNDHKISERKKSYKEAFELAKQQFEQELKELESLQLSYAKMDTLADKLGYNTNLLSNISLKLSENKEGEDLVKNSKLIELENSLFDRENRILHQEQALEKEKIMVQDSFESISNLEHELKSNFEQEQKKLKTEKEKLYSLFQLVSQQTQEKKQEIIKESHKIKIQEQNLLKRKEQVKLGVNLKLDELNQFEELMIQKHEETLKLIAQERRQISEKRDKTEESRKEIKVFEEKIAQQTLIIERRENELNAEVEELIRNKNLLESRRSILESEMQSMHQLSLKLHAQSEEISKSKEQIELEYNYIAKLEEDVENLKVSSKHECDSAKDYCRQLEQKMKTYEKMSLNLIQDLHPSITGFSSF